MPDRIMYVKPGCPYCQQAREALRAQGLEWEERDATARPEWREELFRYTRRTGKVPTIVLAGQVESVGWKGRG